GHNSISSRSLEFCIGEGQFASPCSKMKRIPARQPRWMRWGLHSELQEDRFWRLGSGQEWVGHALIGWAGRGGRVHPKKWQAPGSPGAALKHGREESNP